jgi:hypothetical protein
MDDKKKRKYAKPRLRTIELETREVMLGGCKTPSGAPAPTVDFCSGGAVCSEFGS